MTCPNPKCQMSIPETVNFCAYCGARVKGPDFPREPEKRRTTRRRGDWPGDSFSVD